MQNLGLNGGLIYQGLNHGGGANHQGSKLWGLIIRGLTVCNPVTLLLLPSIQVKVYFVDYGNVEVISVMDLSYLHPKFLVYPFQMIQCCLSDDPNLTYEREVTLLTLCPLLLSPLTLSYYPINPLLAIPCPVTPLTLYPLLYPVLGEVEVY